MYYLEDAREMRQATEGQGELRHIFAEMQAAKRSQAPDAASLHTDDAIISTPTDAEAVARWRASKGLGDGTDLRSRHTCSLESGCSFHRVGADVFVCEATGRAHVCDDDCRERVVERGALVAQHPRKVDRPPVALLHLRRVQPVVAVAELDEVRLRIAH